MVLLARWLVLREQFGVTWVLLADGQEVGIHLLTLSERALQLLRSQR